MLAQSRVWRLKYGALAAYLIPDLSVGAVVKYPHDIDK